MSSETPENVIIRPAIRSDCSEIYRLIRELAEFEKMPSAVKITQETLEKDGFDSDPPLWKAFVAEVKHTTTYGKIQPTKGKLVGYALYFEFYSLMRGRALWLRDLYVEEKWRQHKVGQTLITSVIKAGVDMNCAQVDWFCLSWNPARNFYEKLGAINITEKEDWNVYRLNRDTMLKICSK